MPNWCEGTIRIRGPLQNIKKFLEAAVENVNYLGAERAAIQVTVDEKGTSLVARNADGDFDLRNTCLWVKGSRRHFIEPDFIEARAKEESGTAVLVLPFKAAWSVDINPFPDISKNCGVDIRIFVIESGMEFCQDIEIIGGTVTKSDTIEYEDWDWDCPFPRMGG